MAYQETRPPRVAVAATLLGLLACGLLLGLLPAAAGSQVSDVAQALAAVAAAAATGRRMRGCADRRTGVAWALMGAACLAWAVGEGYWCWCTFSTSVIPFPSLADVGFL